MYEEVTGDRSIDEAIPVDVVKRLPLLSALHRGPADLQTLEDSVSSSRSTIHRALTAFEDVGLVRKIDGKFELTRTGALVARETTDFCSRITTACRMEPFLNTIQSTDVEIPIGAFSGATVLRPESGRPHFAVKRITELIEESESIRILSSVISPVYVDVAHREMMSGTEIEVIFDTHVIDVIESEYRDQAESALETGRFVILEHDSIPFELFLFDGNVGLTAHDEDGIPRAFVETDAADAIEWAESLYERFRREAHRLSRFP